MAGCTDAWRVAGRGDDRRSGGRRLARRQEDDQDRPSSARAVVPAARTRSTRRTTTSAFGRSCSTRRSSLRLSPSSSPPLTPACRHPSPVTDRSARMTASQQALFEPRAGSRVVWRGQRDWTEYRTTKSTTQARSGRSGSRDRDGAPSGRACRGAGEAHRGRSCSRRAARANARRSAVGVTLTRSQRQHLRADAAVADPATHAASRQLAAIVGGHVEALVGPRVLLHQYSPVTGGGADGVASRSRAPVATRPQG